MPKQDNHKDQKEQLFCNRCKIETYHTCKGEHWTPHIDSQFVDDEKVEIYRLWICDGCGEGTLEQSAWHSLTDIKGNIEIMDPDSIYLQYLPPRTIYHLNQKDFKQLPKTLDNLYREVLSAANSGAVVLCAVGIRGLIEGICVDKAIEGRNLEAKIEALVAILPRNIVAGLHGIRFIGNIAAHELTPPERDELHLAIEICEDLLNFLYDLEYKAQKMARTQGFKKLFKPKSES